MLANLNDDVLGIDAMSKRIAEMYLPGVCIQDMKVQARDADPSGTLEIRRALAAVAAAKDPPGFGRGLERVCPHRYGRESERWRRLQGVEWLGDEAVSAYHFNLDPELVCLRRYRIRMSGEGGPQVQLMTVRLSGNGTVLGA